MAKRSALALVTCAGLLTVLGFVMLMSTGGFSRSPERLESYRMKRQAVWLVCGLIGCAGAALTDYRKLQRFAWPILECP